MRALDRIEAALAPALGARLRRDEPLGGRTTYRVGGPAALFVEAEDESDLAAVHAAVAGAGDAVPLLVLGKGSNLLVADAGFPGLVVVLGPPFSWVEIEGDVVRAGGATGFPVVARQSAAAGRRGLEWAVGIPGSVGGALRMNAGGHGSDTAAVLLGYRCFDLHAGAAADHGAGDFHAGYRRSSVGDTDVVVWASFTTEPGDAAAAQQLVSDIVRWRRANQPGDSNAGSVFTNPPDAPAGKLIDEAGCKGMRVGTAEVSAKHANFIQADEGGSADDVRRLVERVRELVAARTGVTLVPELHMVGFDEPSTSTGGAS